MLPIDTRASSVKATAATTRSSDNVFERLIDGFKSFLSGKKEEAKLTGLDPDSQQLTDEQREMLQKQTDPMKRRMLLDLFGNVNEQKAKTQDIVSNIKA